ncbi:hypothetical protein PUN28_008205 [Cardiocondyla obscurior]|uniref:Uncharacterized protein n=1 Tax=Cardiocondyla obscurior TaxID=286306 RepID=A0AAW2G1V9_9HYME
MSKTQGWGKDQRQDERADRNSLSHLPSSKVCLHDFGTPCIKTYF